MHLSVYVIVAHVTTDMSQVSETVDWCKATGGKIVNEALHIDDQ